MQTLFEELGARGARALEAEATTAVLTSIESGLFNEALDGQLPGVDTKVQFGTEAALNVEYTCLTGLVLLLYGKEYPSFV